MTTRLGDVTVDPHDPWRSWQALSGAGPVATEADNRDATCWYLLGYPQMKLAMQDHATFSSRSVSSGETEPEFLLIPGELDPPDHRKYRGILNPLFSPQRVAEKEGEIREVCTGLIRGLADAGECEFMSDFAFRFPTSVFLDLFGLDVDRCEEFVEYTHRYTRPRSASDRREVEASIDAALVELFELRRTIPGDDLATHLLPAEIDGRRLRDDELISIGRLMFIAGLDTVAATLGWMFLHLTTRLADRASIIARPELTAPAVEEFLRYYSVITSSRRLTADASLEGCPMRAGDTVVIPMAPANRDSTQYERAEEFVIDRHPNRHVGFGLGPHRCLGSHLARTELRIALEEWHRVVPTYSVAEGWAPTASGLDPLLGLGLSVPMLDSLPLRWSRP
ncbi:MAG: cytochrome P450 [Actinobacteria bacterium]|nr:cytochrome P450 [Actinomycetota bacterium]